MNWELLPSPFLKSFVPLLTLSVLKRLEKSQAGEEDTGKGIKQGRCFGELVRIRRKEALLSRMVVEGVERITLGG